MTQATLRRAALLAAVVTLAAHPRAAPDHLVSSWSAEPPVIDGVADEWSALYTLDDTQLSMGLRNDERALYIAFAASDQYRRQQLLTAGITIWLDATGGKKHGFGIRVPGIGLSSAPGGARGRTTRAQGAVDLTDLPYFELLGPKDDDRRRIDLSSTRAIQIARNQDRGRLVLELRIPLAINDASPQAIGTRPGQVIGLGLETPKIERAEEPPDTRGGGRGGMSGRGGGRRGGGGRGGLRARMMERAEPLKVWTKVQLAKVG